MAFQGSDPDLILRYAGHVRSLARRLAFDDDFAAEVEQETWLAALREPGGRPRDPRAWLGSVARNAARRLGAGRHRRREHETRAAERSSPGDASSVTPPELLAREEALRSVLEAVGRLPEPVRSTVVLHHLDGLSLRAVARRRGLPLETVRSQSKRGLALLRQDLGRRGGRAAWARLITALRLEPPTIFGVLREPLSFTLMSLTSKTTVLVGGVILCLLGAWRLRDASSPRPLEPRTSEPRAELDLPPPGRPPGPAAEPRDTERSALSPAPETDPEPAPEPTAGEVVVEVSWAVDGRPAAGVGVLRTHSADAPIQLQSWVEVPADGRLVLSGLAPGRHDFRTVFGGFVGAHVVAGRVSRVLLPIPQGVRIHGRVRRADGPPVPGAEVYLYPGGIAPQYVGRVVARSDAEGRFELATIPAQVGALLSARAPGFAPTESVLVVGSPNSEAEVELIFESEGRALGGRVLTAGGQPVAGARVLVGAESRWRVRQREDGARALGTPRSAGPHRRARRVRAVRRSPGDPGRSDPRPRARAMERDLGTRGRGPPRRLA